MGLRFPASPLLRRSLFANAIRAERRVETQRQNPETKRYAILHFRIYHPSQLSLALVQHIVPTPPYERSRDEVHDLHSTRWRTDETRQAGWRSSNESQLGRSPWHAQFFPCVCREANIPVVLHIHGTRRMEACWYRPHQHKNGCWVLCDTHHHPHIEPWLCAPCCQSLSTHDTHTHPYLIARTSRWQ